jgi:hypothetical protein
VLSQASPNVNNIINSLLDLVTRPILIIGPLADAVIDKLTSDYPHKFVRCEPEFMNCNQEALEKGIMVSTL